MWIVDRDGEEPIVIGTPADAGIAHYLRRDYPGATLYISRQDGAHNMAGAHVAETAIVYRSEEQQVPVLDEHGQPVLDEHGQPMTQTVTVQVPERVSLGNTLAVDPDGPALILLNSDGIEVGRLPLEPVA